MTSSGPETNATVLVGGSVTEVFDGAADAVVAAVRRHRDAPDMGVALDTGPAAARTAAGLRDVANDGQLLLSSRTAAAVAGSVPPGFELHDLGIHHLRDLSGPQRVYELASVDAAASPPLRSLDIAPNNLPIHRNSFVGRENELSAVGDLLAGERLVTITGEGGCGKTRLAARAAAASIEHWRHGAWWVELQSVSDPALVAELVATRASVLVEPVRGSLASLTAELRDRRALICMDNCEHVLEAAADLVDALISTCPEVTVLATSREPLGVDGEVVWRLPTLTGDEARELFVERSRQAMASFTVDAAEEAVVQRLCRGLDGIPLAIELAAAWTRTLTPQQIEAGLADRFSLLVRSTRGDAPRHQTLSASIDWSYDMLDERERQVFRRLSVFAGMFTLDAARSVCATGDVETGAVLEVLDRLAAKSLVIVERHDGESRFRSLETIRHYAAQRLDESGELSATRDRHVDHLLELAEGAEPLLDRDKDAWCAIFEPERDNLRAALDWALAADDPERGRRLAAATAWLWNLHGRGRQGIEILRRAIERRPDDRSLLQARLLTGYAMLGDTSAPDDLDPVREGAAIAAELGDDRLRSRCLSLIAVGTFYRDFDAGWELCDEAARLAHAAGDEFAVDGARGLQGLILHLRDRHDEAHALLEPVLERLIRRGDRGVASTLLVYRSLGAIYTGDAAAAQQLAEQAVAIAEPLGDYHRVGTTLSHLAWLTGLRGDVVGGLESLQRFVRAVEGAGREVFVPGMARTIGLLHLWRGDAEDAVRWMAPDAPAAGPIVDTHLDAWTVPGLAEALRRLDRDADAAALLERGESIARDLDMPRVLAEILEQRAHLCTEEDPDRAIDLHHQALAIRVERGLRTFQIDSLEALAAPMASSGRPADATRLLGAASRAREKIGTPRRPVDVTEHDAAITSLRSQLGDESFTEAWEAGEALDLDDAVALVRRTRGQRGRPSTGWSSLTPTELEVVRAVVDGLSNPQIGAKLFMSRGTVKTHLSHVFAKLDVANRTELATYAAARLTEQ